MYNKPTVAILLDTRRENKKKLFPVKLRVTFRVIEKGKRRWVQKYYGLGISCSDDDYKASQSKPKTERQRDIRQEIQRYEHKATKIIKEHSYVNEVIFSRLFAGESTSTVGDVFAAMMKILHTKGKIGNYNFYKTTRNSIARFLDPELKKMKTRKKADDIELNLSFDEVNEIWLQEYIEWLKKDKLSPTTIGIYLQTLRAVFNEAIRLHLVTADLYPFDRKRFKIKRTAARKIALDESDKDRLLALTDLELKFAIDFWAFSFFNYGLNVADIAALRFKDIQNNVISILRQKTELPLEIPLRSESVEIIRKHGNKSLNPNEYVFPILSRGLTPTQIKNRVNDFTGKLNKSLRKAGNKLELPFKLTTYTARHTFASIALEKGASLEFIQIALGHASIETTKAYTAGLKIKTKRAIGGTIYD